MNFGKKNYYMFNMARCQPIEVNSSNLCIWCGNQNAKNKAHIFSKRLLRTNSPNNVLKNSVCSDCNTYFGNKLEDWFFKYSPFGTWTQQIFQSEEKLLKNLKYLPNFIWSNIFDEWMVVNHNKDLNLVDPQLVLSKGDVLRLFLFSPKNRSLDASLNVVKRFNEAISNEDFADYISKELPENFSTRLFLYKEKFILIARSKEEKKKFIDLILADVSVTEDKYVGYNFSELGLDGEMVIHYKWSLIKYFRWSTKIGFEFLSLLAEDGFCFNSNFEILKTKIRLEEFDHDMTIYYHQRKGFRISRLNAPGWLSYLDNSSAKGFPVFETASTNCHKVFIYEVDGYLLFTVQLFDIELCQLVVAENVKLDEIYYIEYDYFKDSLLFYSCGKKPRVLDSSNANELTKTVDNNAEMISVSFYDYGDQRIFNKG